MLTSGWMYRVLFALCVVTNLAFPDRASAQACEAASPNELLEKLRELTPTRGTFSNRFLPAGSEAHLLLRPPADAMPGKDIVYRALVQEGSEFWPDELGRDLANRLDEKEKVSDPAAEPKPASGAAAVPEPAPSPAAEPKPLDIGSLAPLAQRVPLLSATVKPDNSEVLDLALLVPSDNAGWKYRRFLIFACRAAEPDPLFIADAEARVSNQPLAIFLSVLLTLLLAICAIRTVGGRPVRREGDGGLAWLMRRFNPLYLFTGPNGKASLSIFQIMLYTLIVFYLTAVFLGRTGALSTLSTDISMLLGIAVGGSIGGALMNQSLAGLSAESDTWLRSKGWLPPRDQKPDPHLSDLITTGGTLDIYRFQSFAFNLVVGAALLIGGLSTLANFTLPVGLLALLGLSQVAYIGGKAVTPKISDLDDALKNAANAEKAFKLAVSNKASADGIVISDLAAARAATPAEYEAFEKAASDAREYFRAIIGEPASGWPPEPAFRSIGAPAPAPAPEG